MRASLDPQAESAYPVYLAKYPTSRSPPPKAAGNVPRDPPVNPVDRAESVRLAKRENPAKADHRAPTAEPADPVNPDPEGSPDRWVPLEDRDSQEATDKKVRKEKRERRVPQEDGDLREPPEDWAAREVMEAEGNKESKEKQDPQDDPEMMVWEGQEESQDHREKTLLIVLALAKELLDCYQLDIKLYK